MVGSSQSIAGPNIALNTIMAEELCKFADELEQADDFDAALQKLVCKAFTDHQRIIFNGNGYSDDWKNEAALRGLSNLPSTAVCMQSYLSDKNIHLVTSHGIFTESEFRARYAIQLEAYCKIVRIEARTSIDMVMQQILPAATSYTSSLCDTVIAKQKIGASCRAEQSLIGRLSASTDALFEKCEKLRTDLLSIPSSIEDASLYYHEVILEDMDAVRKEADLLEQITDKSRWPYPTYSDLLFY